MHRPYPNAGKPWLASDVLFLEMAALQGMSLARIAGFLGRKEGEVRGKARELEALRGETEALEEEGIDEDARDGSSSSS